MAELPDEANAPPSHRARTVLFLSAMRHFDASLRERGYRVEYLRSGEHPWHGFEDALADALARFNPDTVRVTEAGDWRVEAQLKRSCSSAGTTLQIFEDDHFMCSRHDFARWAGRSQRLLMERFYRFMRSRHAILMDGETPLGGQWNFDHDNRASFGKAGPGALPVPLHFPPDPITRDVIAEVGRLHPDAPGELAAFDWPVTRTQALLALDDFIHHRLTGFGPYQDAIWSGQPWLYHSRLSAALNLHLLRPAEVIEAAVNAGLDGRAPLQSVEGFVRQILGWREFMHGVYWLDMPGLGRANHYNHLRPLPSWFWTGEVRMACVRDTLLQTLKVGYAHHIQRLMITGNFALLAGLAPDQVANWYLGIYVDAVEWVEHPNTLGMALFATGPRFTSKPYIASGAYIKRMSNHCAGCRYRPEQRHGEAACPFTTLYWAFVDRHQDALAANPRTALMSKNLQRFSADERMRIQARATQVLEQIETL